MDAAMVARINELARKKRETGLTPEETEEQRTLRAEYLREFRRGMEETLSSLVVERPDGTREKLHKKPPLS